MEALEAEDARRDPSQYSRRWVLHGRGELRAAAALFFFPFDPPGFLHAVVLVHPRARGQGLGQRLWRVLEEAARKAGASGLAADISDTDPQGREWAERLGFGEHAHRFASELDLGTFDGSVHAEVLRQAGAQGVTFTDLSGANEATLERYLNFFADRLTETPDLAGHPRWPLAQVRTTLHLDRDPHPEWLILAVGPGGEWLGTTAVVAYRHANMAYNELTALHPQARGRGLALPLKLQAIRRAQAAELGVMRTNNHSRNAPMLAVNQRLGFQARPGRFELHLTLSEQATSGV